MEFFGGLGFIYSRVSFNENDLPFEISKNLILRQATKGEADNFIDHVIKTYGSYGFIALGTIGNFDRIKSSGEKPKKFWLVEFKGNNHELCDLGNVSVLMKPKLLFGDTAIFHDNKGTKGKYGYIFGGYRNENIIAELSRNNEGLIEQNELNQLKFFLAELKKLPALERYLMMYISSQCLSSGSDLLTLSLFSIIKSLVVHKPTHIENLDSITSQVKNKINLISKMFDNALDYNSYFHDLTPDKAWSKVYALRSNIAHGESYDFSGKNSCLKNMDNVNQFLDEVVRQLLRLTFKNMELIKDLQAC